MDGLSPCGGGAGGVFLEAADDCSRYSKYSKMLKPTPSSGYKMANTAQLSNIPSKHTRSLRTSPRSPFEMRGGGGAGDPAALEMGGRGERKGASQLRVEMEASVSLAPLSDLRTSQVSWSIPAPAPSAAPGCKETLREPGLHSLPPPRPRSERLTLYSVWEEEKLKQFMTLFFPDKLIKKNKHWPAKGSILLCAAGL